MSVWAWLAVPALGATASLARFFIHAVLLPRLPGAFPLSTLLVNASGSLLLGVLAGAGVGGSALVLVGAASLGSFTTFSTWMLETRELVEEARSRTAIANVVLSISLGLAAVALGRTLGAWL